MTQTLSTTCTTLPMSDHYLETGFTKKRAGPAHQIESACDSRNAHAGDRLGTEIGDSRVIYYLFSVKTFVFLIAN